MKPIKKIVDRNGEKYLVMEVVQMSQPNQSALMRLQREMKTEGFSVLLESDRAKGVYRLLRSVEPILGGQSRPAVPQEDITHE